MALDIQSMSSTQVVLRLASRNQEALQQVSMQIASGNKHDDFKGFAEDATTESFLSYKAELSKVTAYTNSNNAAISSAKTSESSIASLQDLADDLSTLITSRRNGASGDTLPVEVETRGILDKIAGALNVKFNGRYLFAGSKTNAAPVDNIQTTNLNEDNVATDNYYEGNNDVPSIRSSDAEVTDYGILANEDSFKNLIAAAHLLIAGDAANDDDLLASANDLLNTSIEQLATTRASALTSINRMTKANATHSDFKLLIQENLDDVAQTDIVQATSKMSELQTIVEASYLAFSRLSSLQLTNFLK